MRVISSEDVRTTEDEHQSRRVRVTNFCGARGHLAPGPQIFLVDYPGEAGVAVRPHFHAVDQFQVFWKGGRLGRHQVRPYLVHYADAYTPYGPITDRGDGVTYLTVRARPDPGPQYMPEARSRRPARPPGRQLTVRHVPDALDGSPATEWLLGPFADGLAVRAARLRAGEGIPAALPAGDGTVYLLLDGGLTDPDGVTRGATTVLAAHPGEAAPGLRAAARGALILGLSFPAPRA